MKDKIPAVSRVLKHSDPLADQEVFSVDGGMSLHHSVFYSMIIPLTKLGTAKVATGRERLKLFGMTVPW